MQTTFTHPDLAAASVLDALGAAGFEVGPPAASTRVVLDTFDGRLHAAGLRLERQTGAADELVLAGPAGAPAAHLAWTKPAPALGSDLPAGPFGQRVASVTQERALLPLLALASQVRVVTKRDRRGKATVTVAVHDRLRLDDSADGLPPWAVEVVGVAGHDDALESTAARLASLGMAGHDGDVLTVVARAGGISLEGRTSSPTIPLDRRDDALAAYRAVLANLAATVDDNLPGTIADTDPEFLHELRVAVRRTRSVLNQAKGVLPADVRAEFRGVFGDLGTITSPARDLDVYVLGWDDMVEPLQLPDPRVLLRVRKQIERRRTSAHTTLAKELGRAPVRQSLDRWRAWLADPTVVAARPRPIGPVVARRIATAQEAVLTNGRAITPASPPEALHDLRKDAKKLRYLLECFGGLLPTKPRKAFVSQLKSLQDNLGDHQDAEVQLAELRALAHDLHAKAKVDTDALLAMGRLSDLLDRRRQTERDAFVERFVSYDTKANRRALQALLAEAEGAVKVAATYSIKGGVGKTSTAVNLAFEAAHGGAHVLVWDLDPQGAATYLFRVRPKVRGGSRRLVGAGGELASHIRGSDLSPVHVVPADFSLRHLDLHLEGTAQPTERLASLLEPVQDHYDLALLDCPPSISLASESVFGAADALLVPVVPATLAARTLTQLVDFLDDQVDAPLVLPILSMVDRRRRLHKELVESLAQEWPELLQTIVPAAAVIERMGLERAPVGVTAPTSPATRAYRALWAEVAARLWIVGSRVVPTPVLAADVDHFVEHGWLLTRSHDDVEAVQRWVAEVAAWPDDDGEWLHHRELTDAGPQLCRTENFVPFHDGLRTLLTSGGMVDTASALLGEPAVLYKEKINYKLPGGAGYVPHQDAPAYRFVATHVSCMVAVDDALIDNGCLEVVSGCHDELLPMDATGCIRPDVVATMAWAPVEVRAGETLWFHSRTPHRSGPNLGATPRRALYPTYNARSEGDLRTAYYEQKRAELGDSAAVSLIGDFQGRPVT